METLDFGKSGLQTVPLGFVFCAASSYGDRIFEGCVIGPKREFFQGWTAGEELERWRISTYEEEMVIEMGKGMGKRGLTKKEETQLGKVGLHLVHSRHKSSGSRQASHRGRS